MNKVDRPKCGCGNTANPEGYCDGSHNKINEKIVAFGASSSKNSINKELAKYAASRVPESTYEMIDLLDFEMPIYSEDREASRVFLN